MIEIASSALSLRLTKAQQLFEQGKQHQALDRLWDAEALARGNADAIHEMLDLTRTLQQRVEPKQKSRLIELVAALEHDARHATESPAMTPLPPPSADTAGRGFYPGLVLSLLLAAAVGFVILVVRGFQIANPCPCTGDFCIFGNPATGGADAHLNSGWAVIGMALGGIGLLIASVYVVTRSRARLGLLGLIVGFPLLYVVLLASVWGVARVAWGPTACSGPARSSQSPAPRPRANLPPGTQVFAEPNHNHVTGTVHYNRTPPAGGPHNDVWLNCGIYTRPVRNENAVHSLEHGAVWITYTPDLAHSGITRLRRFVQSHYVGSHRYLILSPYPGLPAPVVASAWGAQLRLRGPGDPRLAAFVTHFAGGNQGGEQGGPCTDGTGSPSA
jgi:hypothetical protein